MQGNQTWLCLAALVQLVWQFKVDIAYHDGADESWYEEEHPYHSSEEEAEDEPDYGEDKKVGSMRLVSDDNWRWSWLWRDHNHVLERERGKREGECEIFVTLATRIIITCDHLFTICG